MYLAFTFLDGLLVLIPIFCWFFFCRILDRVEHNSCHGWDQEPRQNHSVAIQQRWGISAPFARGPARIEPVQPGGLPGQLPSRHAPRQPQEPTEQPTVGALPGRWAEKRLYQLLDQGKWMARWQTNRIRGDLVIQCVFFVFRLEINRTQTTETGWRTGIAMPLPKSSHPSMNYNNNKNFIKN